MHPPSRRNRIIGFVALIWFLWCTGTAVGIRMFPQEFRDWSTFTWTDREIAIGTACYFVCGLAGLILVITRLILPSFYRPPRIGYGAEQPVLIVDVYPEFEHFHALRAGAAARQANVGAMVMLLGGIVLFFVLIHPTMRHDGYSFETSAYWFGGLLASHVAAKFILYRSFATRGWSVIRWHLNAHNREPRRVTLFEDGILVAARSFERRLPWYDVTHARRMPDLIGLSGRGTLVLIPLPALSAGGYARLVALLDRKRVLPATTETPPPLPAPAPAPARATSLPLGRPNG